MPSERWMAVYRMADVPMFNPNAPPGYCPWGEAKCDEACGPYHGCLLYRRELPRAS